MSTMTPQDVLRRTYQETSLFGLQQISHDIERAYTESINRCLQTYRKLQTTSEIADQMRDALKQNWRSTPSCSLSRTRCIRRKCRCSYADYLQYRGYREAARTLEQEFVQHARQPYELKAIWRFLLTHIAQKLVDDDDYRQLFLATLVLAGDMTTEMARLADFEPGWLVLRKFASVVELDVGRDPVHRVVVQTAREPQPHERR